MFWAGAENDNADSNNIVFTIKDIVVLLSTKDNQKLSKPFNKKDGKISLFK